MLGVLFVITTSAASVVPQVFPQQCDNSIVSCTSKADACCVPTNGVMVLALQWLPGYCKSINDRCTHDVLDRIPQDQWTIHGLWPDNCQGYQVSDCDTKRVYSDTANRVKNTGIYRNLTTYWVSFKGGKESDFNDFWGHEWSKHGTCYSPADRECVGNSIGADVEKFFRDTLYLQAKYNVFAALKNANIVPSKTAAYKSEDIKNALVASFGALSIGLVCKGPYLGEIRLGLLGTGGDVAKNGDVYLPSTCPRYGVMYAEEHVEHNRASLVLNSDEI
ncbi:ribonuclease T2-like protein [Obelidium mucronatum]|nr:ribonuclease T2-like protein [Obelidium mucronatum]